MNKCQKSQVIKLSLVPLLLVTPLLSTSLRPPFLYFLFNLLIIVLVAEAGLLSLPKHLDEKNPSSKLANKACKSLPKYVDEKNPFALVKKAGNDNDVLECRVKEIKIVEKLELDKKIVVVSEAELLSFPKYLDGKKPYILVKKASNLFPKYVDERKPLTLVKKVCNDEEEALERRLSKIKIVKKLEPEKKIVVVVKVEKTKKSPAIPGIFFISEAEKEEEVEDEALEILIRQELCTKSEMFIGNFYNQLRIQKKKSWNRIHGFLDKAL